MSKTIKIIHVHFISGHHNYYFGSVRAIYKMFSPEELGCSEIYLRPTDRPKTLIFCCLSLF